MRWIMTTIGVWRLQDIGDATDTMARRVAHAAIEAVRATAETLQATLEQMHVVEEMRRTLRDIQSINKLPSQ